MYIRTSFVCSSLRVSSIRIYILIDGLLTNNSTWCQNRGCICISSTRRTYGRIHSSFLHPAYIQTSTIILWTELFPKKRREKIQGEILQSIFEYSGVSTYNTFYKNYSVSTRNPAKFPVIPCKENYSTYRINSSTRILQEILQLQGSSRAELQGIFQQLFLVHPSILHGRIRLPASLQHSRATQHKQASSNSTRQKQHSKRQPASTQPLQ